jgi:broad specificity phosphatase PhoE
LNERLWGDLAGKLKKHYPKDCSERKNPSNGESTEDFYPRSNAALVRLLECHAASALALVVAHKGTVEGIANAFGLDFAEEPSNDVIYKVEIFRSR